MNCQAPTSLTTFCPLNQGRGFDLNGSSALARGSPATAGRRAPHRMRRGTRLCIAVTAFYAYRQAHSR